MLCWLSHVHFFVTPQTVANQASMSMGFPKQEYWSGLPFPSPGDLTDPGIEPTTPALAGEFFLLSHQGNALIWYLLSDLITTDYGSIFKIKFCFCH